MPEYFEIKIQGQFDQRWSAWFAGMKLTALEGNMTMLSGLLPDQGALHGVLERIRDLNLALVSVTSGAASTHHPAEPSQEGSTGNPSADPKRTPG